MVRMGRTSFFFQQMNVVNETAAPPETTKQFSETLNIVEKSILSLKKQVQSFNENGGKSGISGNSGISILNERNFTFLNYLKKLIFIVGMKLNGLPLSENVSGHVSGDLAQNLIWSMIKDRFLIEASLQSLPQTDNLYRSRVS